MLFKNFALGVIVVAAIARQNVLADDVPSDALEKYKRAISFLSAPIGISSYNGANTLGSGYDTFVLDALEELDGRNKPESVGFIRASHVQLMLARLRMSSRKTLDLTSSDKKRLRAALQLLGIDDDIVAIRAGRESRQAVRTRELLSFLFEDSSILNRPLTDEDEENVFRTVVKRRSELNAAAIQRAYDRVVPILLLTFDRFCGTVLTQLPRTDTGQLLGAFEFSPPRELWSNADGWTTIERKSQAQPPSIITGEIKRIIIQQTPPVIALTTFLQQVEERSKTETGNGIAMKTPSGLETVIVDPSNAHQLAELLRSIPSGIYLGRNFHVSSGVPTFEGQFGMLGRTSGTFVFALEYAR